MRIVGGKLKGRALQTPVGNNTRPTSDRAREAIFNVLAHGADIPALSGARVADVFAGTGALGLEALSRGAAHCLFIESSSDSRRLLKQNLETLNQTGNTTVVGQKADDVSAPLGGAVDIAFLDAPYGHELSEPALAHLAATSWFKAGTVVVVEVGADETLSLPAGFEGIKEKTYGAAKVLFLSFSG